MKTLLFLGSLVVSFLACEARCRSGWLRHRDSCYLFSRDRASWGESAAVCNAFKSHLATVSSAEDYAFLKMEVNRYHSNPNRVAYWIDGTDIEAENTWRWTSTGQMIAYLHWAPYQPNNGNASNCMCLFGGLSFDMADEHCSTSYNYICQMRYKEKKTDNSLPYQPLLPATGCRNGWVRFENSCYFFSKDAETWAEASIMCTDLHSHLAILESTAENTFLKAEARRLNAVGYWIDGTDLEIENVWRWTSNGDKLDFTDWGSSQPNQGTTANCLVLWRDFSYQWADEGCRRIYNFLCEMSVNGEGDQVIG
ncbi:C-type mannose receptor 2-like [Ylistrum balloti]|uniref:C-type mannose receptor 2-like n=1 Tax=Ylistrum balloti TaxID=509963 RepID=UPI002905D357|nr:C-type mannose receptor 2-like [Ylistrum balloti]